MKQGYFPGYEKPEEIKIIESGGIKSVVVNNQIYMSWESWDEASQRMAIVQLYESNFGTQEDLSRIFGLHVNSVQNYVADFAKDGFQGLATQRSGPREKSKLIPRLRSKILLLVLKEGIIEYEAIQKRLEIWNESVSIGSIRQVLLENGLVKERVSVPDYEIKQIGLFDTQNKRQLQLQLDFNHIPELEGKNKILLEVEDKKIEKTEVTNPPVIETKAMRFYSQAQRIYLDQLEQGATVHMAGWTSFCTFC